MTLRRYSFLFLLLLCAASASLTAQELLWKAGVNSFFDNYEFSGSSVQSAQTLAGTHLAPEIGLSWKGKHRIFVGVDAMHEWGSDKTIDFYNPVIYYEYAGAPFRFYAGAIPRRMALDRYPRIFFSDSIMNYRPTINGIFWELSSDANYYANVWLDWTGRQTTERHEAFFMGWSGRYNRGLFYAQHFGYMFHFAGKKDPVEYIPVHDNGLVLTSIGIDLAKKFNFDKLETNLGWAVALDRDREIGKWNTPQGLLSETRIEYRGLELFNTYYKGGRQQVFYGDFGNELYWGDPVYRSAEYNCTDLTIHFLKSSVVDVYFTYSLHLTEQKLYHSQAFYATFNLSNITPAKPQKAYKYLWNF